MEILPRTAWGAVPPKSKTARAPNLLAGVTVHWFGSPKAAATHAGCDDLLRSVQRTHMAPGGLGATNGGADIGYNHSVCPHGSLYELRGFGVQTGANGTTAGNRAHAAIVYMAGTGDPLTDEGKTGLNYLIREWRAKGAGQEVFPHKHWTGSTCPGPDILAWLQAGRPEPKEEPVEAWVPTFLEWYLFDRKPDTRPAGVPAAIPQNVFDVVGLAARYRDEKPDGADVVALKAKISAGQAALTEAQKALA